MSVPDLVAGPPEPFSQNMPVQILSIDNRVINETNSMVITAAIWPDSTAPTMSMNFAAKPENGGIPASDRAAIIKATAIMGSVQIGRASCREGGGRRVGVGDAW